MCKDNFIKRKALIQSRIDATRDMDERDRLIDEMTVLERGQLNAPVRSRHAILTKLRIIRDRGKIGLEVDELLRRLASQIDEWRRFEPVLFDAI